MQERGPGPRVADDEDGPLDLFRRNRRDALAVGREQHTRDDDLQQLLASYRDLGRCEIAVCVEPIGHFPEALRERIIENVEVTCNVAGGADDLAVIESTRHIRPAWRAA